MSHPRASLVGEVLELEIGAVAHGGHCVARIGDAAGGRVVFVRHALPGERARVLITEDAGGSFARGDAVEVITASTDRVTPPCPHAGPGRCGGCDWQHATPPAQRELKAQVVREQFARLAGRPVDLTVAELPGGPLHWRTRIGYSTDAQGRLGLLRHRSDQAELVDSCPLGVAGVGDGPALARTWPHEARVEVVRDDAGGLSVLGRARAIDRRRDSRRRGRRRPEAPLRLLEGADRMRHTVAGADGSELDFDVAPAGFWQVHPAAAQTFARAVLHQLAPATGESVLDLYAGAGLFTAVLAHAVGPSGRVLGIESDPQAVVDANGNLAGLEWAEVQRARVGPGLLEALDYEPDLVVLDPPRSGAGAAVLSAVLALGARAVAYVACDPASLARDVQTATEHGWTMRELSAYDAFPMTHHVECIAILTPN